LSISLYTRRQETLQAYPTEALGAIALGLEDLRLSPGNKDGRLEVNLAEQLRYEQTDHDVPARSRRLLDGIGRLLAENPDTRVQVLSHTDDEGDGGFNLRLSQRRADAVKEYLVSRGVEPERITAVGRGEEAPLAGSGKRRPTRAERAKNRRTELVIESVEPAEEGVGQDVAPEGDAATGLTAANETDGDAPSPRTGDAPRQDSTRGTAGDRPRGH
jgi:outer membrane protein OmpA-like peptidoglycan-associated protein